MQPIPDVQLTVVSPYSRATYSGMLPGTLAGLYAPEEMEIDLRRFVPACGARLIVAAVTGFDPERREIRFADRPPLYFDVASIGIGSVPAGGEVWREHPQVLSIKPMATFRRRLRERLQEAGALNRPAEIVVVGAGAAGTEVSLCLEAMLRREGIAACIHLVDAHAEILAGYSAGTIRRVRATMARRGINIHTGLRAESFEAGQLRFAGGKSLAADVVIWATKAAPPAVLEQFQLPKAPDGFLAARKTLQTTADYPVFVVGDTATFEDQPIPKAGVYAVREGPILWENLRRYFSGQPLKEYRPQAKFLSLLADGEGGAFLEWRGFSTHSRWAWKLKDSIDQKFMRMHRVESLMDAAMPRASNDAPMKMRCAGCGSKVGATVLADALRRLNIPPDPRLAYGLDRPDDAAVLGQGSARLDVFSVDFFRAFLDDPYLVGRVAAINALSDLWATGAEPAGALAIVTLPAGPATAQTELLFQLLAGAQRELAAAGAGLWGGHTTEGAELTIGFSVFGALGGEEPFAKSSLQPGDQLILTKRLGTATLLAADQQHVCRAAWMDSMLEQMLVSNAAASRIAREHQIRAATDVTGFGLAGHLLEMLMASGVSARLALSTLPLLDGFEELANSGIRSSLEPANREAETHICCESPALTTTAAYAALFDPQTSGGLLLAVPAARAASVHAALQAAGYVDAAIIGEVLPTGDTTEQSPTLTVGG